MGIIIEEGELNPSLKRRIEAFIDEFFEDPGPYGVSLEERDFGISSAHFPTGDTMMAAAAAAPSEPIHAAPKPTSGVFGRMRESFAARESKVGIAADEECALSNVEEYDGASSLKSWLDQVDEPFSTTLLALIDRKGLTDVDVYKRAHMSRQLFSRIRSDASYRPAKKTVLALAIAMNLSLDETRDLLGRAGFALSHSSKRDLIVEFFVAHGIYDLFAINEALYEFDQPLI